MDNLEQNTQVMEVTENAKKFLKITSSWTNFMAILSFVGIGFLILSGISILLMMRSPAVGIAMALSDSPDLLGLYIIGWVYPIIGIILIFPALFLFRFSQKTKQALANQDTLVMEDAFKNLKAYWKFTGIFTIVAIALCIIMIPIMVIVITAATMM
jgi:hypothetical protein